MTRPGHRDVCLPFLIALTLPAMAWGQLTPAKHFNGVSRAVRVTIEVPEGADGEPVITLLRAGEPLETGTPAPVEAGEADLATLFPVIWTTNEPVVLYAQLSLNGQSLGPPLVLEPMRTPVRARDAFTDALVKAAEARNDDQLLELARLPAAARQSLKQRVERDEESTRAFSGYRVYRKQDVVLETTFGEVRIATRPDAAPVAARTFASLASGGFYDGVVFHRVIRDDGRGNPFVIQAGDPTGRGWGGAGFYTDDEPSSLPHDFGVLSVARRPFDPNTNGAQFFVCLSREGCAGLDGLYTSFAEVVDGADAVEGISLLDLVVEGDGEQAVTTDRPVEPAVIERARVVDSPPVDRFRARQLPGGEILR